MLILLESTGAKEEQRRIASFQKIVTRGRGASLLMPTPSNLPATAPEDELLGQIWSVLRTSPSFLGVWPAQSEQSLLTCARQVATRLKVYKVVVLDAVGAIWTGGSRISFMNGPVLSELLRQGEAEWAGLGGAAPPVRSTPRHARRRGRLYFSMSYARAGEGVVAPMKDAARYSR